MTEPIVEFDGAFSEPGAGPVPWADVAVVLTTAEMFWNYRVGDDTFSDEAGRTGLVFVVRPAKTLSFGKAPYTQTRYRFP